MSKKQLSAAQGIEAACILFQLNSKTADILRLAENAGLPSAYAHGPEQARLRAEWLAFVHAVVTAHAARTQQRSGGLSAGNRQSAARG